MGFFKNKVKDNNIFKNKIDVISSKSRDNLFIAYTAAKCCYGGKIEVDDIEKQCTFIKNKMEMGHESIIEHTNLIFVFTVPNKYINDVSVVLSKCQYLYTNIIFNKKYCHILIGGSIRGYKNLICNMLDQTNYLLKMIKTALYQNSYSEFYQDLIDYGILSDSQFKPVSYESNQKNYISLNLSKNVVITESDNPYTIYDKIKKYGFTVKDVLNVCKITVKFVDISRTSTAQLNRHRNAISQQSQRYIDFSTSGFVSTHDFKSKYYEDNSDNNKIKKKYYLPNSDTTYTMDEIANSYIENYNTLLGQGIDKEDARNYLPGNINTTEYVTFTGLSLLKFIELRDDDAAQGEIHNYAKVLKIYFKDLFGVIIDTDDIHIYDLLLPEFMIQSNNEDSFNNNIDEIIDETIESI